MSASYAQAIGFVLMPQHHGSIDMSTVIGYRRLLEDRVMARLAMDHGT